MAINRKFIFFGHHFLQPLNGGVLKFDDLSALGANQMIVVLLVGNIIIQGPRISEMPLLGQATAAEQIQGSVNRRQPYPNIPLADLSVKILRRDMIFAKKRFQNNLPLMGQFESMLG
jgi:hypothetical protein